MLGGDGACSAPGTVRSHPSLKDTLVLDFFLALALVVAMMLTYLRAVQVVLDPDSALHGLNWQVRVRRQARRESADLDREHASLIDEHRFTP